MVNYEPLIGWQEHISNVPRIDPRDPGQPQIGVSGFPMLRVALTGGIACGKSLAGSFLARHGAEICEADALAHAEMKPGEPGYQGVVEAFGSGILDARSEIDRWKLGRRVFARPAELARLNGLVHPGVRRRWAEWLRTRSERARVAVVIVPLLYEIGAERGWDAVVCVGGPVRLQMDRLRARGFTDMESERRISAQMPLAIKMARSDVVVWNGGTGKSLLAQQMERTWRRLLESRTGNQEQRRE